jgi:hypothetical protein
MSRSLIVAVPLLLATPALAQEADAPAPTFSLPPAGGAPAQNPTRQGPELDVYRDTTPRAAPPVVAPTVTPTPAPVQAAPPQAAPSEAQGRPVETRETPTRDGDGPARREAQAADRTPAAAPSAESASADGPGASTAPAVAPAAPASADTAEPAAPAPAQAPAPAAESDPVWPWIMGGLLALAALAGAFWLRSRRVAERVEAPPVAAADRPAPAPAPAPLRPTTPVSVPPAADAPAAERPWLDMDLFVAQARFSLMGVTIAYRLTLHNRGEAAARDVMVRGILGNAGAQQQALLEGFFGGAEGLPLHSAVAIAPGETVTLAGELRLTPDRIVPVAMGERQLLIPLAAFDAAYRWGAEDAEPEGHGRTARAFIVGQEQEPPADRLAPLRLDQGPRQYRRPAARAAAELTPA